MITKPDRWSIIIYVRVSCSEKLVTPKLDTSTDQYKGYCNLLGGNCLLFCQKMFWVQMTSSAVIMMNDLCKENLI